jgi:hypothetical protein
VTPFVGAASDQGLKNKNPARLVIARGCQADARFGRTSHPLLNTHELGSVKSFPRIPRGEAPAYAGNQAAMHMLCNARKEAIVATIDKFYPSKFLKPAELDGEDIAVTVHEVGEDNFKDDDGTQRLKPILYFREKVKPLILNKTNFVRLMEMAGGDTDNSSGTRLVLYADKVSMRGKSVDTIRLRSAPKAKAVTPVAEPAEADTDIPF